MRYSQKIKIKNKREEFKMGTTNQKTRLKISVSALEEDLKMRSHGKHTVKEVLLLLSHCSSV